LPFIYDDEKKIEAIIKETKDCGGQYILESSLTLKGYCKQHFFKALEKYDPALIMEYNKLYDSQDLFIQHSRKTHQSVLKYCQKYGLTPYIPRPIEIYPKELQINKKIAERFYLESRELQISGSRHL